MQLIQVTIYGQKFEGNFMNPDVMENYEKSVEKARERSAASVNAEKGSQAIRIQCEAICDCVDEVLGEGSAKKLMPDGADLLTCLDIYDEICHMGERQLTPALQRHSMKYSAQRAKRNAKPAD